MNYFRDFDGESEGFPIETNTDLEARSRGPHTEQEPLLSCLGCKDKIYGQPYYEDNDGPYHGPICKEDAQNRRTSSD